MQTRYRIGEEVQVWRGLSFIRATVVENAQTGRGLTVNMQGRDVVYEWREGSWYTAGDVAGNFIVKSRRQPR